MTYFSFKQQVFWFGLLLSLGQFRQAVAVEVSVVSVQPMPQRSAPATLSEPGPIISTSPQLGMSVTGDGRVVLEACGRDASGQLVTRQETLPYPNYQVDEEPYEGTMVGRSKWYKQYIVFWAAGHRRIIGESSWTMGHSGSPEKPELVFAALTNLEAEKDWGFDTKLQKFWIQPDPKTLPVRPKLFTWKRWKGLRFLIPLELQKMTMDAAKSTILWRGGMIVSRQPADVVVLPDDIDFIWGRNKRAESAIRNGAMLLWERNFTNYEPSATPLPMDATASR